MLSYDSKDVYLGFAPTPVTFASVAQTPNQIATANALQGQPAGSPLYNAIIGQTAAGARVAFDALSGEIHASAFSAAFDDSRLPREAVLDRLSDPYDALPSSAAGFGASAAPIVDKLSGNTLTTWGQAFSSGGHLGGNGNAASLNDSLGGFILGADESFDNRYRLGLAGGYTQSSLNLSARGSGGNLGSTFGGLYGGAELIRCASEAARSIRSTVSRPAARSSSPASPMRPIPPTAAIRRRLSRKRAGAFRWRCSPAPAMSSLSLAGWSRASIRRPSPRRAVSLRSTASRAPMILAQQRWACEPKSD